MEAGPGGFDIERAIADAARQQNIDPQIFRAMLMRESSLNPSARGPGGELGIAQFTPATAASFRIDPLVPSQAIPAAALYMRQNLDRFGGNYDQALAAYNWGPGNVARQGLANAPPQVLAYIRAIKGGLQSGGNFGLANQPPSVAAPGTTQPVIPLAMNTAPPAQPPPMQLADMGQGQGGLGGLITDMVRRYQNSTAV